VQVTTTSLTPVSNVEHDANVDAPEWECRGFDVHFGHETPFFGHDDDRLSEATHAGSSLAKINQR
jgi:hypothetical protein